MRSESNDSRTEDHMTLQTGNAVASNTTEIVMTGAEYLQDPEKALGAMRRGLTVVVESIVGGARMVLSGQPLSAVHLDDTKP